MLDGTYVMHRLRKRAMVDLPLARFRQRVDPAAGGPIMESLSAFCYCAPMPNQDGSSGRRCGCSPAPLWEDDVILPQGVSVGATAGSLGRIGIAFDKECPPGTVRRSDGERAECTFGADDYVYFS